MIDLLTLIGKTVNESDFKKRMRLHQGWWRAFVLAENEGKRPGDYNLTICNTMTSGEKKKKNLLSNVVKYVVNEVLGKRKDGNAGLVNEERLYNNLLSSQPLCFNFFALLYSDKKLALNFLRKFYPELTAVNEVYFEFANSENKFDNSAFDVAFDVNDGSKRGIIGFECKYTDSFSTKEYGKEPGHKYETIYKNSGIWSKPYNELTVSKFNQLFRNQLIGESFKQNTSNKYDFARLGLFCHHKDEEAIKIAEEYRFMLNDNDTHNFELITYKDFFETIMKLDLSWNNREYFMLLWARYCGLKLSNAANEQLKNIEKGHYEIYDVDMDELENLQIAFGFEGGQTCTAEKDGEFYIVFDQRTLNSEFAQNKLINPVKFFKFTSEEQRKLFLNKYKKKIIEDDGI